MNMTLTETSLDVTPGQRNALLHKRAGGTIAVPALHLDTNKYRRGPSAEAKEGFRAQLLQNLQQQWGNGNTKTKFLELAHVIDDDGCALFGGLIDTSRFEQLITKYAETQKDSGNKSFLHSYVNLADHPDFLRANEFNDAFAHPLLIALIAYRMGGAIRIVDIRGKDTDPISVNAQDNMLHIDNTPFRQEYKVLVGWQKGVPKGPAGQNFTYLPGTHKGNRDILLDASGEPWATERGSLFVSNEAIDGLLAFQEATGRTPTVVEAQYPDQPITIAFAAGALVHHRYRTEQGNSRSCMIAAFHVGSDNPGALINAAPSNDKPRKLIDILISHQDTNSTTEFMSLLSAEAHRMETKISEIFDASHHSALIDTAPISLTGEKLSRWRETVVTAPSVSTMKLARNIHLTGSTNFIDDLTSVMMYDKHGLLQLILYQDGREEIRKLCRNRVREMKRETIAARLVGWLPVLASSNFSIADLPEPWILKESSDNLGSLVDARIHSLATEQGSHIDKQVLKSLSRLIYDLGEAITRREEVETFVSTSLFLFWAADDIAAILEPKEKKGALEIGACFLRNYVASVLLFEGM